MVNFDPKEKEKNKDNNSNDIIGAKELCKDIAGRKLPITLKVKKHKGSQYMDITWF